MNDKEIVTKLVSLGTSASAALSLLKYGIKDDSVVRALKQGEEFCDLIDLGEKVKHLEYFSIKTIIAEQCYKIYSLLPKNLLSKTVKEIQILEVKEFLTTILSQIEKKEHICKEKIVKLSEFFFEVSELMFLYF